MGPGSENIPEEKAKELLAVAREIRETVGRQYSAVQDGEYAGVAARGECLRWLFYRWEEMVRAAGDAGGSPPPEAGELIREALELNEQAVALLQQNAQQMQEIQQELLVARRTQRAYAAAQQAGPPLFNATR